MLFPSFSQALDSSDFSDFEENSLDFSKSVSKVVRNHENISSSVLAGTAVAMAFHPYDRGLFLAISENRSFFNLKNFKVTELFQGLSKTVVQRMYSNGSYFGVQGAIKDKMEPYLKEDLELSELNSRIVAGLTTGTAAATLNNPPAVIKYLTWTDRAKGSQSYSSLVKKTLEKEGLSALTRGAHATMSRDALFGTCYKVTRDSLVPVFEEAFDLENIEEDSKESRANLANFSASLTAAIPSTIISAPLNFVRNNHYRTPLGEKPQKVMKILKDVVGESSGKPIDFRASHLAKRFMIGPGTVRVVSGVAIAQTVFDSVKSRLTEK